MHLTGNGAKTTTGRGSNLQSDGRKPRRRWPEKDGHQKNCRGDPQSLASSDEATKHNPAPGWRKEEGGDQTLQNLQCQDERQEQPSTGRSQDERDQLQIRKAARSPFLFDG